MRQRLAHVLRHRPGHHQHVGVARRGDEAQAEAFEIVERIIQRVDFQFAAVAGAGIDLADRERTAEPGARGTIDALRQFGERGIIRRGRRLGQRSRA